MVEVEVMDGRRRRRSKGQVFLFSLLLLLLHPSSSVRLDHGLEAVGDGSNYVARTRRREGREKALFFLFFFFFSKEMSHVLQRFFFFAPRSPFFFSCIPDSRFSNLKRRGRVRTCSHAG